MAKTETKKTENIEELNNPAELKAGLDTSFKLPNEIYYIQPYNGKFAIFNKQDLFDPTKTLSAQLKNKIINGLHGSALGFSYPMVKRHGQLAFARLFNDEEKELLEKKLGVKFNYDDIRDPFLENISFSVPCNEVKTLDLSIPMDYIFYKILLSDKDMCAKDLEAAKRSNSVRLYLSAKDNREDMFKSSVTKTLEIADLIREYTGDKEKVLDALAVLKPKSNYNKSIDIFELQSQLITESQEHPDEFLAALKSPTFFIEALLRRSSRTGIVRAYGSDGYVYNGQVLGNSFLDSVNFLKQPENSALLVEIRNQLK